MQLLLLLVLSVFTAAFRIILIAVALEIFRIIFFALVNVS